MAVFKREDLVYTYTWESGNDYMGTPFKRKHTLDRNNGYDVLAFCNQFLIAAKKPTTLLNFRHVEWCLHHPDLCNVNSLLLLKRSITANWFTYLSAYYSRTI